MIKVFLSKYSGFCKGVESAIEKALHSLKPCLVLGNLIHNKMINNLLEKEGVFGEDMFKGGTPQQFLIPAHGISKERLELISDSVYTDATCPNVQLCIDIAKSCKGALIIIGDKNHSEVKNVSSYANSVCVQTNEGIDRIPFDEKEQNIIVGQTTVSRDLFELLSRKVLEKAKQIGVECIVKDTLCSVVEKRIQEARLYSENHSVIVIGDKTSANSLSIYNSANRYNDAYLVENESDMLTVPFSPSYFITTATSAPIELTKQMIAVIKKKFGECEVHSI